MQREHVEALAAEVAQHIRKAVTPLQQQLAVQGAQLADLQRRVQDDAFTKELGGLRERVAVLEVRPVVPGPPGDPGPPGKDGVDGTPGLTYQGVFQDGKAYELGDVVTWAGSTWHCNAPTETKPGEGAHAWTLMVKRGRDGKDGKP
jgi:hypothetical protein